MTGKKGSTTQGQVIVFRREIRQMLHDRLKGTVEPLPPGARGTRPIDEEVLDIYLAGANRRRIHKALDPPLGEEYLSRSAVSRVVGRLKCIFAQRRNRDLSTERQGVVFLGGFHLKVQLTRRVVSVPVLPAPLLLVVDAGSGLNETMSVRRTVKIRRCVVHKLQNLQEPGPVPALSEMTRDDGRIVYARNGLVERNAYEAFITKRSALPSEETRSLQEAPTDLLTFHEFPRSMRKSIRTPNLPKNLSRESRRRTKTQASFSSEETALRSLHALLAFDQITLQRIHAHRVLRKLMRKVSKPGGRVLSSSLFPGELLGTSSSATSNTPEFQNAPSRFNNL